MNRGRNSKARLFASSLIMAFVLFMLTGCGGESAPQYETKESSETENVPAVEYALSDTARAGEVLFNANCSLCHGVGITGTSQGPSLIDGLYHPGHHADPSIRNAVSRGVIQHHWFFGDMPPVPGVSSDDVEKIICYIREVQRANDIFEGDAFPTVC